MLVKISGSSSRHGVSVFLFPVVDNFRGYMPRTIEHQIITLRGFSGFIVHEVMQVVIPLLGGSSCFSLGFVDLLSPGFHFFEIRRDWHHFNCFCVST